MQRLAHCKDDELEDAEDEDEEDYDEDDDEGASVMLYAFINHTRRGLTLCLFLDEEDWTDAYLAQNA